MPTEIFSFLQTQVNTQFKQFLPGIIPQENNGAVPGMFDAIISEYALTEDTAPLHAEIIVQNNAPESSQPITSGNDVVISGKIMDILAEGNPQSDSAVPDEKQPVAEDLSSWKNLFADVRRSETHSRRLENFAPQSDFDDGITAESSEVVDVHGEIPDVLPPEDKTPAKSPVNVIDDGRTETLEISAGNTAPEITAKPAPEKFSGNSEPVLPENHRPTPEIREHNATSETTATPVITKSETETPKSPVNDVQSCGLPEHDETATLETATPKAPVNDAENYEPSERGETSTKTAKTAETPSTTKNAEREAEMPKAPVNDVRDYELPEHDEPETPKSPAHDTQSYESSHETAKPLITEEVSPENHTPTPELTAHDDVKPEITEHSRQEPQEHEHDINVPSGESVKPENSAQAPREHIRPDNVTVNDETSAENATPENITPREHEEADTAPETPAKFPERHIPRKSHVSNAGEPVTLNARESRENTAEAEFDAHGNTQDFTPDLRTEIESPRENENSENQPTIQNLHSRNESESREISEPLTNETHEIISENDTPEEHPEINGNNLIMAGAATVPTEIRETPENDSTPKTSRTQAQTPRKLQAMTRGITDSGVDTQDITAESSRTVQPRSIQPQSGHDETPQPETSQPSESQTVGEIPAQRVTAAPARASRTPQRTESRNDSRNDIRRTEALNDFQTFFDGAMRTRRTSSRLNTQPLSLRTGTYEAAGTQSQSQTLRNGIVNTVRFIRADGVRKANIIVDPPALGRISVELTSSSSGVEASVKVANEQIRQIVQDQFTQLRDNLLQQGVQVSEFTVDVQQDSSRQGQDSGGQNQRDNYTFTASENDDDTEVFRADLEEGLLYWIA